jgi:hypothetical protein
LFEALRVLEPYAVKVARTVLRREGRGNPPDLSDGGKDRVSLCKFIMTLRFRPSTRTHPL